MTSYIIYAMRNTPTTNEWLEKNRRILGDIETAEDGERVLIKAVSIAWAVMLDGVGAERLEEGTL